ncbi:MAG: hypothetical protein ILP19_01105 [Oscillospiraceae bacterium]|nr:hypothetical protein [Oscillospiraceae bacterium]
MDIKHMYLDALTDNELDKFMSLFGSRLCDTDEECDTDDEKEVTDEPVASVEYID